MESGRISQNVYVLNSSYNSADMLNLFVAPTMANVEHNKYVQSKKSTMQTKIPQAEKDTFNEKTRKSLLKINLFIKRLKRFNIFTDPPTSRTTIATTHSIPQGTNRAQISGETNPKCKKFINSKKTSSTKEMYREATKLLGIDCSLSSSCRCCNCQSSYFDYESMDGSEDDNSESECDTDSSDELHQLSDEDRYTNCFLIHSEELCEFCCQKSSSMSMTTDIGCNDFSFNTFLS